MHTAIVIIATLVAIALLVAAAKAALGAANMAAPRSVRVTIAWEALAWLALVLCAFAALIAVIMIAGPLPTIATALLGGFTGGVNGSMAASGHRRRMQDARCRA